MPSRLHLTFFRRWWEIARRRFGEGDAPALHDAPGGRIEEVVDLAVVVVSV